MFHRITMVLQMVAIPLATTDLSCERGVKDLTCRRYAADEMKTHENRGVRLAINGFPQA